MLLWDISSQNSTNYIKKSKVGICFSRKKFLEIMKDYKKVLINATYVLKV